MKLKIRYYQKIILIFILALSIPLLNSCKSQNGIWYVETMNLEELHELSMGDDIAIAVIDTGIDSSYLNDHINQISSIYNIIDKNEDINDEHGHGTEMASILLGDTENNIIGISPKAKLHIIKAIGKTGSADNKIIADAVEYAIKLKPDIINLSLGSYNNDHELESAINHALSSNIIVVASCGDYYGKELLYPAAYSNVVSVQGVDEKEKVLENSNVSSQTTFSFPGSNILTISYLTGKKSVNISSGSSEAAIIASGYFALLLSYGSENNVFLSNDDWVKYLKTYANDNKCIDYIDAMTNVKDQ